MALPPFPLNLLSSSLPSPSLSFLILQTGKHASRTLKLETFCSSQTIEVESEESHQSNKFILRSKKTNRKLKPSFYDQVQERWCVKNSSQRTKFPWQEQQQQQEREEAENQQSSFTPDFSEANGGNSLLDDDPVCFTLGNRLISAPWMHGRKPRKTHYDSETEITQHSRNEDEEVNEFRGYGEKSATDMIVEKLRDFEKVVHNIGDFKEEQSIDEYSGSLLNISVSPGGLAGEKEKFFGGDVKGVFLDEKRAGSDGDANKFLGSSDNGDKIWLPWEKGGGLDPMNQDKWNKSNTELAEKTIPSHELQRLRKFSLRMMERIKVGAAGITQALVDSIHENWKQEEVVKLKFEAPSALNMKRTHDALERKTGGIIIWRCGSSVVLFRGIAYKLPCVQSYAKMNQAKPNTALYSENSKIDVIGNAGVSDSVRTAESSSNVSVSSSKDLSEEFMDLSDLNTLLDELGPRYEDWQGRDPQPVDADLLPCVVPGYNPPFRLLPHGFRHCLGNKQMTSFRRLARTVPPHFALGRNKQLQGLAVAMVKLWKRSSIAKIAIKRGVLNTCNERMAEEIKKLTGGTLLSRNKDFIVFYRGNDFLSPAITEALVERQKLADLRQDEEEQARQRASSLIVSGSKAAKGPLVAGTLAETKAATSRWGNPPSIEDMEKMLKDEALARHASLVRYLEKKLAQAQEKVKKAEKALGKVQEFLKPTDLPTDLETITDEERFLFRKIGHSMKPFLLLGRRGLFDGTVENMHLHWKFRELVKIIVKNKSFAQVKHIAISLEAESGGLLVSVDKTFKGYVIIVYRGKNYQRPQALRPMNLLTKRQALARSIELQRREALIHHISDLQERIEMMKSELNQNQMDTVKEICDKTIYSSLSDIYSSDDDMEDEGEEAYLETYDIDDEDMNALNEELIPEKGSI